MWRKCRFTEGSSLKDRLLWVFITCVAPIVEEHDIGLCRVTDILNAIYVAETGYVRARVRIFVSLRLNIRSYFAYLLVLPMTKKVPRQQRHTRAFLCARTENSLHTTTKLAWILLSFFLFALSPSFHFFHYSRHVSTPLNALSLSIDIPSTFDTSFFGVVRKNILIYLW